MVSKSSATAYEYFCVHRVVRGLPRESHMCIKILTAVLLLTGNVMVVMDSFALPVEGTETRVNAHEQAYEYMTAYMDSAHQVNNIKSYL